jgi:hypothetical protein
MKGYCVRPNFSVFLAEIVHQELATLVVLGGS